MKQKFKRALSVILAIVTVISGLQLSGWTSQTTAKAAVPAGTTIYFDASSVRAGSFWDDGAVPMILLADGDSVDKKIQVNGVYWQNMTVVSEKVYSYTIPSGITNVTHVQFRRSNPTGTDAEARTWNSGTSKVVVSDANKTDYVVTSWNKNIWTNPGTWKAYSTGDETTTKRIYFEQPSSWDGTPSAWVYNSLTGETGTWVSQAGQDESGYYYFDIDSSYDTVIFAKDRNWSAKTGDYPIVDKHVYTNSGDIGEHVEYYYVATDLVDYINDTRIDNSAYGNVQDGQNQGGDTRNGLDKPFSYFNQAISGNNYDHPLYFGLLSYIGSRKGHDGSSLGNWNSTANIALANGDGTSEKNPTGNWKASVQGLVKNTLGEQGQLLDTSGKEFPYFTKNEWTVQGGTASGRKLMEYYPNLSFPFKTNYDAATGVTTYSYDSGKDYSVYYDYDSNKLKTSNNHTTNETEGAYGAGNWGYFPFNTPGETTVRANVNYGFGTKFTIPFTINKNGTVNGTPGGDPITFKFTGDDDVWVFLDGKLILDMGGAHGQSVGEINFKEKTATVSNAAVIDENQKINGNSYDKSSYIGKINYIYSMDNDSNGNPTTVERGYNWIEERSTVPTKARTKDFSDYGLDYVASFDKYGEPHTLTMFYMERGMKDSNMSISFTMTPLPSGLSVGKTVDTTKVNAGLKDAVLDADDFDFALKKGGTAVSGVEYTLKDYYGDKDAYSIAEGGIITGVNANTTAYNFVDATTKADAFNAGDSLTITEDTNTETILTYDYNQTTYKIISSDASNAKSSGTLGAEALINNMKPTDYSVIFNNVPITKDVKVKKAWERGTPPADTTYEFTIQVDLDGDGTTYDYMPYALAYTKTVAGATVADAADVSGKFNIAANEELTFSGIPVGAKVKVTETVSADAAYEVSGDATQEITVSKDDANPNSITITNKYKPTIVDKVVYMEAEDTEDTDAEGINQYRVKDGNDEITITNVEVKSGTDGSGETPNITATVNNEGESEGTVNLHSPKADEKYEISYEGTKSNGSSVTGTITAYTYRATKKVYVFDYGLASDIAKTNSNSDGLFQDGVFYNQHTATTSGNTTEYATTAYLSGDGTIKKADASQIQTSIEASNVNGKINPDGTFGGSGDTVTFTPKAFMNQVENYTYQSAVKVNGKNFSVNDHETGTLVNGTIKVMPASVVYYEDNFNASAETTTDSTVKIVYTGSVTPETEGTAVTLTQSNGQTERYGYDDAYNGKDDYTATVDSAGASTKLTAGAAATFTFKGTGFDIIARTTTETAGIACGFQRIDVSGQPIKFIPVDTYYANGALYQIPVIHKEFESYGTYRVTLLIKESANNNNVVYLDGIRIYNPLDTSGDSAYIDNEEGATVTRVSDLILGEGVITEYGIVDENGVTKIKGQAIKGASAALLDYAYDTEDKESDAFLFPLGYSKVEDINGNVGKAQRSILTYLNAGPTNEMYLDYGSVLAFVVTRTLSDNNTIQIEAKLLKTNEAASTATLKLKYLDKNLEEQTIDEVKSSTAMYYEVPVEDSIKLADNKYLVVILGDSRAQGEMYQYLSFSNLKVKGYDLSNPLEDGSVSKYIDNSNLTESTIFKEIQPFNVEKRDWSEYKYTVTVNSGTFTNHDDAAFHMYYVKANGSKTAITVSAKYEASKSTPSEDVYSLRFKAPNATGQFPVQLYTFINGKESSEYISTIMTVK